MNAGYYFLKGVMRAIRRGHLFPAAGREAAQAAPGGSRVERRLPGRRELDRYEETVHGFPMKGLERPIRVLHLSDIHLREVDEPLERLAELLRPLRPDLLVLTGDVLTRGWKDKAVDLLLSSLPPAPLGRYAVMGNWEYWGGAPEAFWQATLQRHGVELLHNRSKDLGPLQLVGTDDWLSGIPDLPHAFSKVNPERPTMVLSHSPQIFPALLRPGVQVVLSGHTHGGQVRFPLVGPFFLPKGSGAYPWGWYEKEGVWMFVNRGLGWSLAPVRWRAPPEIAWIELTPA